MTNLYSKFQFHRIATRRMFSVFGAGLLLFCLALFSCSSPQPGSFENPQTFEFEGHSYELQLTHTNNDWLNVVSSSHSHDFRPLEFPYPVWYFEWGNLNQNEFPEILVGVEKTTKYDPVVRKRMFIYELKNDSFQPLWKGSRLPHPLAWFRIVPHSPIDHIRTMEYEENRLYLVAEYEYGSFGVDFLGYLGRDLTEAQATQYFYDDQPIPEP